MRSWRDRNPYDTLLKSRWRFVIRTGFIPGSLQRAAAIQRYVKNLLGGLVS